MWESTNYLGFSGKSKQRLVISVMINQIIKRDVFKLIFGPNDLIRKSNFTSRKLEPVNF